MDLQYIDVKIENKNKVLMLLCSLSNSYENFIDMTLYGRWSITLEDVKAVLNSKELKKRVMESWSGAPKGLLTNGKSENKGHRSRGRSRAKS